MTRLARVTAHLAEHGPATPKQIAEALGASREHIRHDLTRLVDTGRVVRAGTTAERHVRYALVEAPSATAAPPHPHEAQAVEVAAAYQAGATLIELARRFGLGVSTVRRRLALVKAPRRPSRQPPNPAHPATHRVIQHLASALATSSQERALDRAGVSDSWWRDARIGRRSPNLACLEALANVAGYEIVLRRRMG